MSGAQLVPIGILLFVDIPCHQIAQYMFFHEEIKSFT